MGLTLDPQLAESIATNLAEHAHATGNFVRIDMEDSPLTQGTLDIVRRLHARTDLRGAIGIVIQAYLYRSQADIEQLIADGIRVRLCKGAYKEPAEVAFPRKADVDANYVKLSQLLLESPIYHGLATHDEAMIEAAKSYVQQHGIAPSRFEFQMLFGVRRDLQRKLVARDSMCASTFRSDANGIPTSCAGWRNGRRMSSFWRKICCAHRCSPGRTRRLRWKLSRCPLVGETPRRFYLIFATRPVVGNFWN